MLDETAVSLWAKAVEGALAERELSRCTPAELRSSFSAYCDESLRKMRRRHRAAVRRFRLKQARLHSRKKSRFSRPK